MKFKSVFLYCIFFAVISCKKESVVDNKKKIDSTGLLVKSYSYQELKPLLERKDDKTYIINFWATWCSPCVKELPDFEKIRAVYATKKVEVLLVSLDFPKQKEKKLIPFLAERGLQSKVVLLDDINEDVWIKAIDSNWSGAIPATIIYNKKRRKFYEQSFDYETLEGELNTFLKN
jgi:thiol-disulfide isomerase/thioredoxin